MVEYFLYMELPFDYVSLEFESYLDKLEDIHYSAPNGNKLVLHISKIIDSHFKNYIFDSFKKLIPEVEITELFTLKSLKFSLFFLIIKIYIKRSESEYYIEDQLNRLLKWFPFIFDFFPEIPRMERIITNIPIIESIKDKMVGHFIGLFNKKKIREIRMEDCNFKSFISEYPRLSNSNILKTLYKYLHNYYRDLFWNYNITIHPFNFYGMIPEREGSDYIALFRRITNYFHTYLISLYSYIGEDMNDFLREVESFQYSMNPFEFKKLIEYERLFEEIYENFFSNEIPIWCRARFEKWVFEHYKDEDFELYKPVMIYRLPNFPKTYIKLRKRLQEVLNNVKNLVFNKSNLIKSFERVGIIKKFFPFLKPTHTFKQDVGQEECFIFQKKLRKLKEKCAQGVSASDCETCEKIPSKICLTKIFSYHLGKEVLPHCGTELADCYWISENDGFAIVIKGANMNTKNQYMDSFSQINDLTQRNTVKTIFFANNKSTSNQFLIQTLNLCKANKKQFIVFNKDELIQFLYFYEKLNQDKEDIN